MKRAVPLVLTVLAALAGVSGCSPSPTQPEPITVALSQRESLALIYVAQDRNLFAKNGLRVTYREYDTGAAALGSALDGDADIAAGTAEFPLMRAALTGTTARAIASIDRPDFIYVIGRKDRGIGGPADLKGKRIGTPAGTIAQFYLGRFLELSGMTTSDISFVDLKTPTEWRAAIEKGDVDAVVLAQPEANLVQGRLGENATFFSVQGNQPAYTLAIAADEWIAKNPRRLRAFLAALAEAEDFVSTHPAEAKQIMQRHLNLGPEYMRLVDKQNAYALSLDQSLIVAMEDEARWLMRSKLTTATAMPDFGKYVDVEGLKAVRPEAVNIIR